MLQSYRNLVQNACESTIYKHVICGTRKSLVRNLWLRTTYYNPNHKNSFSTSNWNTHTHRHIHSLYQIHIVCWYIWYGWLPLPHRRLRKWMKKRKKRSSGCNGGKRSLSGAACHKQIRSKMKIHPDNARIHKAAHQPTNRSKFEEWTEQNTYMILSTTTSTVHTSQFYGFCFIFDVDVLIDSAVVTVSLLRSLLFCFVFLLLCFTFSIHIACRRSCIRGNTHAFNTIHNNTLYLCVCKPLCVSRMMVIRSVVEFMAHWLLVKENCHKCP